MKKFIAYLLVAMMSLSCLAACGNTEAAGDTDAKAAVDYVFAMYKDAGTVTAMDYERVAQVMIGGKPYTVEWTVDNEAVKITVADKVAKIDVDEKSAEDVAYTLTATVTDADGNKASKEFKYTVPKFEGFEKIVEDAYKLESGATMDGTFTLEGVIVSVDTPYDSGYGNVTVTIQVGDLTEKTIMCYRLAGEGADTIKIGDTITVTGSLTNYNGTIEFAQGCTLDKVVVGDVEAPEVPTVPEGATMEEIVDIAYTLISGQQLDGSYTLTGVITSIPTPYDEGYQNVTVVIQVGDKADKLIECFRMKGDGAADVKVGDTITVTGNLKNYSGKIEFDAGCTLDSYTAGSSTDKPADKPEDKPEDKPADTTPSGDLSAAEIMALVEALAENTALDGTYKLSGKVLEVSEVSSYGDVNVTMEVDGTDGKTIYCYGLKGEGNTDIVVGDTITVEGSIKDYNGTKEFYLPQLVERKATGTGSGSANTDTPASNAPATDASAKDILTAAYALEDNASLGSQHYTLTGVIKEFKYTYSPDFDNIQCTIIVDGLEDMPIVCYKLKGEGIDKVQVGSTITVTGEIKNYNGTVEFNGCTLDSYK